MKKLLFLVVVMVFPFLAHPCQWAKRAIGAVRPVHTYLAPELFLHKQLRQTKELETKLQEISTRNIKVTERLKETLEKEDRISTPSERATLLALQKEETNLRKKLEEQAKELYSFRGEFGLFKIMEELSKTHSQSEYHS